MKILRIIYDWPKPWQGLASGPFEITNSQLNQGHEVEILCGYWPRQEELKTPKILKFTLSLGNLFPELFFSQAQSFFFFSI